MTIPVLVWGDVFPTPRVEVVLRYVVESWEELRKAYPQAHVYEMREEKLTDSLAHHLDDPVRRQTCGIPGHFVCERLNLRRLPDGKVKRASRSDIVYFDAMPGSPQLVMEFKKLAGIARLHKLYCSEGIARFVKGIYSPHQKFGVMCGILKPGCADPGALMSFLGGLPPTMAVELGCQASGYGVTTPSTLAPSVATFDSRHARGSNCSHADITLAHFFVTACAATG